MHPFELLNNLRNRMAEAVISQSGIRHKTLANHLRKALTSIDAPSGLIPAPVLEGAFPFVASDKAFSEFSGPILDKKTVDALVGDDNGEGYSFPRTRRPYLHQEEAWKVLTRETPTSAVITAGTGSGKTECFLVPLLDSLYRKTTGSHGVEAIIVYPLNALIASQQERLDAWTKAANGTIRYCLYKGDLPERLEPKELKQKKISNPQQIFERETLRQSPPPVLVTNITMLEYMLLRPQDRPILEKSKGKLKWIILDEAHTLIGSSAAEVALLLRRVMKAFYVNPSDVRFVATSATIGEGPEVKDALKTFLADVGGIDKSQIEVITGNRQLPSRPGIGGQAPDKSMLDSLSPEDLYTQLGSYDPVWQLIENLKDHPVPACDFDIIAQKIGIDGDRLAMALTRAQSNKKEGGLSETLAPLRFHAFHRAISGLWCCTNPDCKETIGPDWPAGKILYERIDKCPACAMPVAELVNCNDCGEIFMLLEEMKNGELRPPRIKPPEDEYQFEFERDSNIEDNNDEETEPQQPEANQTHCFSISNHGSSAFFIDKKNGLAVDCNGETRYRLSYYPLYDKHNCPCCGKQNKKGDKLYPFRFGAPFIISNAAPLLLEEMPMRKGVIEPDLPQTPPILPSSGRQLISFTDSRQGTARMAAKLQIESERTFTRSFIYQNVQFDNSDDEEKITELKNEVAKYKSLSGWDKDPFFSSEVKKRETCIQKILSATSEISWQDLMLRFAERREIREWIPEVWGKRTNSFQKGYNNDDYATTIAEALLLKEFSRRPRRANSMETMGLARLIYPPIEQQKEVPAIFKKYNRTLQDWRNWLGCIVTFSIRNNLAFDISHVILRWIMRSGISKSLVGPGREANKYQQAWPFAAVGKQNAQVVKLLFIGLGLDKNSRVDCEEVNDCLKKAWNILQDIFPFNSSGEQMLQFQRLKIGAVKDTYLCPITNRLIELAPFGLTPYAESIEDKVEKITMPKFPVNGDKQERQQFLTQNEQVQDLRSRGIWTNLHDRTALFAAYTRSAEHSAQLEASVLRKYESDFKTGQINYLNCSTTMEMGVDIGSVNGVMMTNVPPSIANYRQRVGRAGRRGQPLSLAFTFAKDRPLDREAFRNPAGYLKREIAAPSVSLDSQSIVQRHVNAYLFYVFIGLQSGNPFKMKAGDFFGCLSGKNNNCSSKNQSPFHLFKEWLSLPGTAINQKEAIAQIVHSSILAGRDGLVKITLEMLQEVKDAFFAEWSALKNQLSDLNDTAASRAIENQLKRLSGEFLLSELADRGFLPGHGFPNHVVSFETMKKKTEWPIENPSFRHGGPKRPLDIAIRDYAPGNDVVIDGLVYRVGGVSLNWQKPIDEKGTKEIQSLRWSCQCKKCGDCWTGSGSKDDICRTCGDSELKIEDYLQPSGFLRDERILEHAEIEKVNYIKPEPTRVSAGSVPWESLFSSDIGRFRINRRGSVFYHSQGEFSLGYGLCLDCGRMAPIQSQEIICTELKDHRPLRKISSNSEICLGNTKPYAIRNNLSLGFEIHTDVLELQPSKMAEPAAANAIAIAIREEVAQSLGIETDEIGYNIGLSRNFMEAPTYSIFLFDRAVGGAGYVVKAADNLRLILKNALKRLNCPEGCLYACSSCVLVSDAPDLETQLDRKKAIDFMVKFMQIPEELAPEDKFVQSCVLSDRPLSEIDKWLHNHGQASLTFWMAPSDITTLDEWVVTDYLSKWSTDGHKLMLAFPEGTISKLDNSQILFLRDYAIRHHIEIAEGKNLKYDNGSIIFAYANAAKEEGHVWGSRDSSFLKPDKDWNIHLSFPAVGAPLIIECPIKFISLNDLRSKEKAIVVALGQNLEGKIENLGVTLSDYMLKNIQKLSSKDDTVREIHYSDRYVRSPLVLKLLIDTVSGLAREQPLNLKIETAADRQSIYNRNHIAADIEKDSMLLSLAKAYGKHCGLTIDCEIGNTAHKRTMTLSMVSGKKLYIDFDQGFGWLHYKGSDRFFDTKDGVDANVHKLSSLSGKVERRHNHDSQMVLWN